MSLIGISSRLDTSERKTFALEDVSVETSKLKSKEKNDWKKMEHNIQELWDNYKSCNICVMRI